AALLQLLPTIGYHVPDKVVRIGAASLLTTVVPVVLARLFLTHFFFSYKRWMFEKPKNSSITTRIWGIVRYFLTFVPPLHKSCDAILPSNPVPVLEETVQKYLDSIRPLHTKEELATIERIAQDFLNGEGRKLQRYTKFYSLFVENYVTGFWEKYAYLSSRSPLLINSSICNFDNFANRPATQAFRAAHITYNEFLSQLALDRQHFTPPGAGMVCTRHYDRLYAVTRLPGATVDSIKNYGITRHIVVLYNGGIYKIQVVDEKDKIYTVDQLADIYIELLSRANTKVEGAEGRVAALTNDNRSNWHANRHRFFESIPRNAAALEAIESAAFAITLDAADDWGYDPADSARMVRYARSSLMGDGADRWVDKSLSYNVARNGVFSGTEEHSIVDGSELSHVYENFVEMENEIMPHTSLEEQQLRERSFDASAKKNLRFAERIEIDVTDDMASEIDRVFSANQESSADVHLSSLIHRDFGKGRIKKIGCSPDGFMQMAIQLANYRDQGRFVLTYEPASARFYKNSRTETIRSVTDDSCEFVKAMDDGQIDRARRVSLLRKACETHATRNRDITVNQGIDRHLFVLYVMSKATGTPSPFLDHFISQEWLLSTSQAPNMTNTTRMEDEHEDQSWLGGVFAAVAKTGYGVCYRFAGNHSICIHMSSYHSAQNTDSDRFSVHLAKALEEMSALFD
ncbi:hypothetical protein PFISCL1PPCAC_13839, partial [Pristionchus fissidentatus]